MTSTGLQIELQVLEPADQTRLCDDWENSGDAEARDALLMIEASRQDIKRGCGAMRCLACGLPVVSSRGVTHCLKTGEEPKRGVICRDCTATRSKRDRCMAAANSLADHLHSEIARTRGGTFVSHAVGHA